MDPQSIESKLIERNIHHFGQASNTPLTSGEIGQVLEYKGTNDTCLDLLQGHIPPQATQCSPATNILLQKLADGKGCPQLYSVITYDEFLGA
jgi:hypothetical protein